MDRGHFWLGGLICVAGLVLVVVVIPTQTMPPFFATVHPAVFPSIGASLMTSAAGLLAVRSLFRQSSAFPPLLPILTWATGLTIAGALVVASLATAGYMITGVVLVAGLMRLLGRPSVPALVGVSVSSTGVLYLIFAVLLGRPLP